MNFISMRKSVLILLLLGSCFSSCHSSVTDSLLNNTKNQAQTLQYNLTENGCSTGDKTFSSLDELCQGLRNDSFNNNCAQSLRFQKFQNDCPGRSW